MTASHSKDPDLDWSQVRETVRMMNLAVAQIEMSMKEGDDSVDALTKTFTTMATRVQCVETLAKQKVMASNDMQDILAQCDAISAEMHQAIIAFQFYDKLTQRLSHVSNSLGSLVDLVGDNKRLFNPIEWSLLQAQIKSKYTMPAEHLMFELMMQGMSIEDVLKQTLHVTESTDDDIELF
jgi:multidrug resistance efflux pump